ncbi:MAG: 5-oxoprolinase subunit PxpB, partial [Sporomusaceae bacterium]|nr:5-oxoprolinase subunit PxpB [Sporomusaceae bacterium]
MDNCLHEIKMLVAGEYGLVVEFGTVITPQINALAQYLTRLLASKKNPGIIEVIPTYRSVMINFDALVITRSKLSELVRQTLNEIKVQDMERLSSKVVYVPVCYGGVFGPDLEFVARYTGLSAQEVIAIHASTPYLVYMLGFTPGFPYLGGMSDRIAVPRREKPRDNIPGGSVGIGGNQTGFYPVESPGEWWLIGRTPVKGFNAKSNNPFLFSA